jgi:hypothetical protein
MTCPTYIFSHDTIAFQHENHLKESTYDSAPTFSFPFPLTEMSSLSSFGSAEEEEGDGKMATAAREA